MAIYSQLKGCRPRLGFSVVIIIALTIWFQSVVSSNGESKISDEPVVVLDLTNLFQLNLKDESQRRFYWDELHLVAALEGLVNRDRPRLFVRYLKEPDDFWWQQMRRSGGWLAGRKIVRVKNVEELLTRFQGIYQGAVVWDERVPATANLASTIAGCDNVLPLRFDAREDSLYRRLTTGPGALPVKIRLLRDDGSPLFTGTGIIPDTSEASSGSAKCDAYLWLIEKYIKTGKANPLYMGYYLDAFWLKCWNASKPENNTLCNQDFVIARRGIMVDLDVWNDEAPVDDPQQRPGTDAATLRKLLRAAYDRFHGNGMIQVAGFVPWAYKYTTFKRPAWSAGGHHEGVATEWRCAATLSCFNAYLDADAIGIGAMANASFYQHYPLADHYAQKQKPTRASMMAQGLLDHEGRIVPRTYVGFYAGDYDSAAWLYQMLPKMWRDPARGRIPLSWPFNPNLAERFPLGMAWARQNQTTNDWFVAGDSGAGYLNPGYLTPPRPESGLPSGLDAWEKYCEKFYQQWDISLTGFIINGSARAISSAGLDAYARFSPDGVVSDNIGIRGVHDGMPFLQMTGDLGGNPADAARSIRDAASGLSLSFLAFRSVLKTPTWYSQVAQELNRTAVNQIKIVDLYSLLWLVREYQTNVAARPLSAYATAEEISARPERSSGLQIRHTADGPFTVAQYEGVPCWLVKKHSPSTYLYFAMDDGFRQQNARAFDIQLEYLDTGTGHVSFEYDSADQRAPSHGAYKPYPTVVHRGNTALWKTAHFRVTDARFQGSENAASDFRFYNGGDDLPVRAVHVQKE